ncbi:uncharacterized protein ZC262.2 isoform X1 [Hydra vulgaris]|uniref:uncharacterized protein ZC262.2 isoform X1 n=1 Tax=Hydra vulgaris TaxID=6087 RepID=UPI0001927482|nr:uncharacterized protein ZC262.2 [Hydra vulgaris]XP_047143616.1 uncharacterized protein ZC262.2 [Hydra vulgaris]XP_047143617.1 uncharacterized protein ZC262.2 [Hydra vulgaris]XP_047143618.1 uncharacterized protein ZC262.2 [Hydra vulgaris]
MSTDKKKHRCDEENSNEALVVKKKKKSSTECDYDKKFNDRDDTTENYQDSSEATENSTKKKKKSKKSKKEEKSDIKKNDSVSEECKPDKKKNKKNSEHSEENLKESKSSKSSEEDESNLEKRPYAGQWSEVNLGSGDRKDKFLRLLGGYKSSNIEKQEKKKFSNFAFSKKKEERLNDNLEKQYETAWSITREKRGLGLGFDNSATNEEKKPSFSWS